MLRISKLTDYATVLMAAMAQQSQDCVSASRLAEITRLELPTTAKVLKTLARAGLVDSVRGVNGGYRLTASPPEISVAAVVRAMEGPIALTECGLEPGLCSHETDCSLRGNWQRIGVAVEEALERITLADLVQPLSPRIPIRTRIMDESMQDS